MKTVNYAVDLGTTNSLIAKFDKDKVVVFRNPMGHKESLASVVGFRNGRTLIGEKAREYLLKDPVNVFGGFKRKMGTDEVYHVSSINEDVTPVQLSTYILQELKSFVPDSQDMEAVVITIPASFDTMQSNATLEAGKRAGFSSVFLLQEPIAAALTYFNQHTTDENINGYWLVYDLGGGTFDVALVKIEDADMKIIDHEGNNFLGGVDFDAIILSDIIVPHVIAKTGIKDFKDQLFVENGKYEKLYNELVLKSENAKIELSNYTSAEVEFSMDIDGDTVDFVIDIDLADYQFRIQEKVQDTIKMINEVMLRNHLSASDINQIVLVGGSTYSPFIRKRLKEQTGIFVNANTDPTTAIAVGAAYYAANKYYESVKPIQESEEISDITIENILNDNSLFSNDDVASHLVLPFSYQLSYNKTSKEDDELLMVRFDGQHDGCSYRVYRIDGGYDTGIVLIKPKINEFLHLVPSVLNSFIFKLYDAQNRELPVSEEIKISHGLFSIDGQPLPKDICVEVDDIDNNQTRLEVVFEKNSLLPQKKILYREISKTIKKGSPERVVINILEGDRHARPLSNLVIGCIEIKGKELLTDLVQGSDIEIQISMSESRILTTEIFLVMSGQTYKNVFSISEKNISVSRLREQYYDLEKDLRHALKQFSYNEDEIWLIEANALLRELTKYASDIEKLKEKQKDDKRYIIADAVSRISRELDKLGGGSRIDALRKRYLDTKDRIARNLHQADVDKEQLKNQYNSLIRDEDTILHTKNGSVIEKAINRLDNFDYKISMCTSSYIILQFTQLKNIDANCYRNYSNAKSLFAVGDKYLEEGKFLDLRNTNISIIGSLRPEHLGSSSDNMNVDFKGTGIR